MHRNIRWIAGLVVTMLVGMLLAACGGSAPAEAPTSSPILSAMRTAPPIPCAKDSSGRSTSFISA